MTKDRPLFAFFGHHKGATSWMNSILGQVCEELRLRFSVVHYPEMFGGDLKSFVEENKVDFLSYDNADYKYVKQLDHFRAFHVVRDPRDICISAYYSHLYSHPLTRSVWKEQREKLQSMSKTDGLLCEMQFREEQFNKEMYGWDYSLPNVLEVKMEELTRDSYNQIVKLLDFVGLVDVTAFGAKKRFSYSLYKALCRLEARSGNVISVPVAPERIPLERLLGIVWANQFSKKAGGRKPGEENVKSHFRKGVPGDWKNHFESIHYDYFSEHYSHVLLKLGYEQDPNWATPHVKP